MAAAGRGAAWLLPAGRRDWLAAVWAEAHEVPPGMERLAWRAGGVWMLAREALMPRRLVRAALFAAAAAVAAWAAWPEPTVGHAAVSQFHVIATVLLLAGLPLLARRFFGPVSRSRAGRSLRVFCCAAVLAFMPALAIVEAFTNLTPARPAYKYVFCIAQGWSDASQGCGGVPGRSTGGPPWPGEIVLLLLTAGYVGVILFLTSRRSRVTRARWSSASARASCSAWSCTWWHPSGSTTTPPIRGCRDRGSIRSWCWPGSCWSAARPWSPRWPAGGAANPEARSRPTAPGSARASPPGCWRPGPARCSSPPWAPAPPR